MEGGSFAAAARALGVSQSKVSKSIAALEQRLQTQLLLRTTRRQSLTPAGETFFGQALAILAAIGDAEESARQDRKEITGRLRVNTATMLAEPLVLPALLEFQNLHEGVSVDIMVDDRRIDLIAEGVHLIVRLGKLENSTLMVCRAGTAEFGLYASPAIAGAGSLPFRRTEDVEKLSLIGLGRYRLMVSNALLARAAALAGAGIAPLPSFLAKTALRTRELLEVIPPEKLAWSIEVSFLHGFG